MEINRYMVDAADLEKMEASRNELHSLLDKPQLAGIPVLVLGNKRDIPGALDETGLIERMYELFTTFDKRPTLICFYILFPGIYRVCKIEKFVVIAFRVRKKPTSILLCSGLLLTQKVKRVKMYNQKIKKNCSRN